MIFPELLETERLTLRRPRLSDAGPMTMYAGDLRVAQMLTRLPHPYPPGAAEAFIARSLRDASSEHVWVMDALKIDGPEFIGVISVKHRDGEAELGYWVGPPFWNTGYASEAAGAVVAAAREVGLSTLRAQVVEENEASAHVLTNAGFSETGVGEDFGIAANAMLSMRLFELAIAAAPVRA